MRCVLLLLLWVPFAASATPVTFDFRASNIFRNDTPGFDEPLNIRVLLTYDTDKNKDLAPDDPEIGWYNAAQSLDVYVNDRLFAGSHLGPIGVQDSISPDYYMEHFYFSGLLTAYDNGQQLNLNMYSLIEGRGQFAGNWDGDALITDVPNRAFVPNETMFLFGSPGEPGYSSVVGLDKGAWTKVPEPGTLAMLAPLLLVFGFIRRLRRMRSAARYVAPLLFVAPAIASAAPVTFDFRATNPYYDNNTTPGFADPLNVRILMTYDTAKNQDLTPDDPSTGTYDAITSMDVYVNDRLFAGSNFGPIVIHDSTSTVTWGENFSTKALLTAYDNDQQVYFQMYSLWQGSGQFGGNWNGDGLITDAPQVHVPSEVMFFFGPSYDVNEKTTSLLMDHGAWTKVPEPETYGILGAGIAAMAFARRRRSSARSI